MTKGDAVIEIYNGQGIHVQALGEDFLILLHDLDNGKNDFKHDDAMSRLKELNLSTFNRKQALIICIYLDQINDKLIEAGGDPFTEDWYTTNELYYIPKEKRSDYNAMYSWYLNSTYGSLTITYRYSSIFRCRPIINKHCKN